MVASVPVETRDRTWSPVLDGLTAGALDCIQTGLAALADRRHGAGTHLVLGARLGFEPTIVPGRPPTVEVPVARRLAEAHELAGLRVVERRDGLDGPALRRFADERPEAGPLYVVADAFTMLWTPYRGHRHMEHSLLLVPSSGDYTVVDPYHNDTEWGVARPGVWRLSSAELDAAISPDASAMVITADRLPAAEPAAVIAENARALAGADLERYLADLRDGSDRPGAVDALVFDIWLLGRSRLLHAAWLETVPGVPAELHAAAQGQAWEWLRLAAQSYVGLRRVRRGSELPPSVVERLAQLLAGDVEFATRLAARMAPDDAVPAEIRETVLHAVRTVLRLDGTAARSVRTFRALPNFNSFRLVDIIEQVELTLGVVLRSEDLTVDGLRDIDSLARLFARARARR
jgi:hypothetical protein